MTRKWKLTRTVRISDANRSYTPPLPPLSLSLSLSLSVSVSVSVFLSLSLSVRCRGHEQAVQLVNRSATEALAFRFVAVRLSHLYGMVPRQGWVAAGGAVRIEMCLHGDIDAPGHGAGCEEPDSWGNSEKYSLDPWRSELQAQPHAPDVFGLEIARKECGAALKGSPRTAEKHEDAGDFWQALDTAAEQREAGRVCAETALVGGRVFRCELLSEVVATAP